MIRSMTGFGRGEYNGVSLSYNVELKGVNNKYTDVFIRMPSHLNFLEDRITKRIKSKVNRGRIEVNINQEYLDDSSIDIEVDRALAKKSFEALQEVKEICGLKEEISLDTIINFTNIINVKRDLEDEEEFWLQLEPALDEALENFIEMKLAEGKNLKAQLEEIIIDISNILVEIEKRSPIVVKEQKENLNMRLADILEEIEVDQDRLSQEIAYFVDKVDVKEEIVRLKSHLSQFKYILMTEELVGRRLDFLAQEMNREINTIGSKTRDIEIARYVVEVKSKIDQIREQVQNIE